MLSQLIVGIDLGTTHTAVAYTPPNGDGTVRLFELPQLVTAAELARQPLLPSVLYAALPGEGVQDPYASDEWTLGEFARRRAAEVPGRSVASAKSWLCHAGVDRNAAILPWGVETPDTPRLSPVEASARILRHVRAAWNAAFADYPLERQTLILTVPASFDGVARELTVRAAARAGLHVRLLEEPQAAFYDYLTRHGSQALDALLTASNQAEVLVCDVGGGTTDLTLIRAARAEQELKLSRIAVGRHLLLGGDNIDLSLAHSCEARLLEAPERLEPARFGQLTEACRKAKEALLGPDAPELYPIRLLSGGSALVGSTLRTELTRAEVESLVFQGFLPTERQLPTRAKRSALVGFGLPYETDPAITHHLSEFLSRHLPEGQAPRAVLFNGGLFRSPRVQARLLQVLSEWFGEDVQALPNADPDLAVARGAVAYGLALLGRGPRIEAGAAHGYYVGVLDPGAAVKRGLCVVPRGAAEGELHVASSRALLLRLGEPVRFDLYAADHGALHAPGSLVELNSEDFSELTPLVATLPASGEERELRVHLEGALSAVGTVELGCVEADVRAPRRVRLEFDLRDAPPPSLRKSTRPAPSLPPKDRLEPALTAIDRVFGKGRADVKAREVKDLWRELERLLGERVTWSGELNRALYDAVLERHPGRRRSADHERVFFMLAGFCLRPGFGHPKDPERIAALVPLAEAGLGFAAEARSWQQLFIALRRVAGGIPEAEQARLRALLAPTLAPEELKLKRSKQFRPPSSDEVWELASWLERVPAEERAELGHWIVERTYRVREPRLWTWLGRVGARVPAYASAHYVVSRSTAERWVDHLLREKWADVPSAPEAALRLARVSGDRARDLSENVRAEVVKRLEAQGVPADQVATVRDYVPVAEAERAAWFEDVPLGLRLSE